jgi:hypothetical protein
MKKIFQSKVIEFQESHIIVVLVSSKWNVKVK